MYKVNIVDGKNGLLLHKNSKSEFLSMAFSSQTLWQYTVFPTCVFPYIFPCDISFVPCQLW